MTRRPLVIALALAAAVAVPARAQDSQFGVTGLGTVGRQESARARATAGAFTLFDAYSPAHEAPLVEITRGTIAATGYTSWRTLDFDSGPTDDVRQSRFPSAVVAWRSPWGFTAATGFAVYLDRSYDIVTRDSVLLRGQYEPYTDEIHADGGVMDLRLAAASQPLRGVSAGVALHVLTGSAKTTATRRFDDSLTYRTAEEEKDVEFGGAGISASAVALLGRRFRVAAAARSDSWLRTSVDGTVTSEYDLPLRLAGGVEWAPRGELRVAASVRWAGWAGAPNGHDTFGWSLGAEAGSTTFPVRVGLRRDEMAFGPGSAAPVETGFGLGFAKAFAGGRSRLDLTVERLHRSGEGLDEKLFTILFGFTIQP